MEIIYEHKIKAMVLKIVLENQQPLFSIKPDAILDQVYSIYYASGTLTSWPEWVDKQTKQMLSAHHLFFPKLYTHLLNS